MRIRLNGAEAELRQSATVADLVHMVVASRDGGGQPGRVALAASGTASPALAGDASPGRQAGGIAVAVNEEVVPRSEWGSRCLADADVVEILTPAQGG